MDLVGKKIGAEGAFDMTFVDGKLKLEVKYDGKGADAGLFVMLESDYFLDLLKKAIPGEIDNKIIDMLKLAFKI